MSGKAHNHIQSLLKVHAFISASTVIIITIGVQTQNGLGVLSYLASLSFLKENKSLFKVSFLCFLSLCTPHSIMLSENASAVPSNRMCIHQERVQPAEQHPSLQCCERLSHLLSIPFLSSLTLYYLPTSLILILNIKSQTLSRQPPLCVHGPNTGYSCLMQTIIFMLLTQQKH